jgi:hypothetical protein
MVEQTVEAAGHAEAVKDVAKMLSSVIVGGVAAIGATKTYILPYFAASGPALEFHELKVGANGPGQPSFVVINVSKFRACKPSTIVFELTDSTGRTYPVDLAWTRALAVRKQQSVTFDWIMPKTIKPGPINAYLSATHANCEDGGRAPQPQDISAKSMIKSE